MQLWSRCSCLWASVWSATLQSPSLSNQKGKLPDHPGYAHLGMQSLAVSSDFYHHYKVMLLWHQVHGFYTSLILGFIPVWGLFLTVIEIVRMSKVVRQYWEFVFTTVEFSQGWWCPLFSSMDSSKVAASLSLVSLCDHIHWKPLRETSWGSWGRDCFNKRHRSREPVILFTQYCNINNNLLWCSPAIHTQYLDSFEDAL